MSFLVLVITDRVQKALVNQLGSKHPLRGDKYGLVHYCKGGEKASASATADAPSLELPEDMPIAEAYFRHVEREIYTHPKARKMLSLDGDPVRGRGTFQRPQSYSSLHTANRLGIAV